MGDGCTRARRVPQSKKASTEKRAPSRGGVHGCVDRSVALDPNLEPICPEGSARCACAGDVREAEGANPRRHGSYPPIHCGNTNDNHCPRQRQDEKRRRGEMALESLRVGRAQIEPACHFTHRQWSSTDGSRVRTISIGVQAPDAALGAERGPTVMLPTARVVSGLRWERSDRVLVGRNDVILSAENQFELHRRT